MATTTFSGPIKAGTIKETTGTTVGTDKANVGFVLMAQSANVVFGDDGTTTVVATVPANSQIFQITVDVTTAFDAGTTNTLILVMAQLLTSMQMHWPLALKLGFLRPLMFLRLAT